jgi:hypothetical protein
MKKLIFIGTLFLMFGIVSCDKINNPIQSPQQGNGDTNIFVRKVLLEDYTGHYCGNCPSATAVAENLEEQHHGKLILISVHAGHFAKLYPPLYITSSTCTAGNDWDGTQGFGISAIGNPNGMVNRKNYNGLGLILGKSQWPSVVSTALTDTYILGLELKTSFNESTRMLNTNVKANFKTAYNNQVKISVVLVEDSIISEQKNYDLAPASDYVPNYLFMDMLRAGINGSWGTTLKDVPILANDSISVDFNNFLVDTKFKAKNLYVIAFAYAVTSDPATNREVLQVEKVSIMNASTARSR